MKEQPCACVLRCFDKLSTKQRKGLGNFDVQNACLCGCVKVSPVKRHYSSTSNRGITMVKDLFVYTRLNFYTSMEYLMATCHVS